MARVDEPRDTSSATSRSRGGESVGAEQQRRNLVGVRRLDDDRDVAARGAVQVRGVDEQPAAGGAGYPDGRHGVRAGGSAVDALQARGDRVYGHGQRPGGGSMIGYLSQQVFGLAGHRGDGEVGVEHHDAGSGGRVSAGRPRGQAVSAAVTEMGREPARAYVPARLKPTIPMSPPP
jgi:hypothetical protein